MDSKKARRLTQQTEELSSRRRRKGRAAWMARRQRTANSGTPSLFTWRY